MCDEGCGRGGVRESGELHTMRSIMIRMGYPPPDRKGGYLLCLSHTTCKHPANPNPNPTSSLVKTRTIQTRTSNERTIHLSLNFYQHCETPPAENMLYYLRNLSLSLGFDKALYVCTYVCML